MVEKKLATIPGFSQGVRPGAAARMVKLARPICPNSKVEMERTPEGRMVPKREGNPDRQNCQAAGGAWWIACEEKKHDPYFSTRVWYSKSDTYEEVDGEQVKTGEKTVRHETRYPNIAQVAAHRRVNSGRGAEFAIARKGFKRLKDIGYEEVCQFRNCQKPVTIRSKFGLYCDREHATLIAADAQGILDYQIPGYELDLGIETQVQQKKARIQAEAALFADIVSV